MGQTRLYTTRESFVRGAGGAARESLFALICPILNENFLIAIMEIRITWLILKNRPY